MTPQGLNPGDKVVALAALTLSASVFTGAVAGACVLCLIKKSWLASAGGLLAGAIAGFIVGRIVAVFYNSTPGQTTVVKTGAASLAVTFPAALAGGIFTSVAVGLITLFLFSAWAQAGSLFGIAIGCGVVVAVLFACLSSLT